jgi:hypothetical protein
MDGIGGLELNIELSDRSGDPIVHLIFNPLMDQMVDWNGLNRQMEMKLSE